MHLNAPNYPKHMTKGTDRVRALCPCYAVATAAPLTLHKPLLALASLFQEPKTWLLVSFRSQHLVFTF